jgi:hypothetical protein
MNRCTSCGGEALTAGYNHTFGCPQTLTNRVTDTPPLYGYGVRKCRGHWHVISLPSDEDIAVDGDPFATQEEALEAAERARKGDFRIETPPSEPWPFNHAEFRLKVQDGMRCSWGVYGVHPYLEGALKACDRIDELLKANGYIASEAIRLTDENESLTAQLEAANKVVEAAERWADALDVLDFKNTPEIELINALAALSARRSPDSREVPK